jgi:hypothetical protein
MPDHEAYLTKSSPGNCSLVMMDFLTGFMPGLKETLS